ncbi:MAG: polyprenyl synthetase family protein [Planctomycetaceae bacterium]
MHRTAVVGEQASAAAAATLHECPEPKAVRERLRAMAADCVASWKAEGRAAAPRTAAALREQAERIVRRAGASPDVIGWTMVAIVSEHWRERLGSVPTGRRLLLLPDCPVSVEAAAPGVPRVCGPSCGIATIWAAARDHGWAVESTSRAVAAIGSLVTGQYDGVLGVARLRDLEKAFAMLPAFALPIAAVPYREVAGGHAGCAEALAAAAIDVEWVLGLLGVAGGDVAPVGDYLPLLREAAGMFEPRALDDLASRLGMRGMLGSFEADRTAWPPLEAAAEMSGGFLSRGGKFLRPFVTLAAFDAVTADLAERPGPAAAGFSADPRDARDSARAAAVAIEVFHKASLVHDDIEDSDAVRYGRATLHEEVGVPSAVNAGDYLLGVGYRLMAALPGLDAGTLRDAVAILADAHVRLARGQGAELWWRDAAVPGPAGRGLTPDEALTIYGLKTSPAFEAAVALGVRLAGGDPARVAAIDRYALHVGTGFQVLNDLKDWSGDLENDRREAGDLIGGRPTLLWALALEGLADDDRAALLAAAATARRGGEHGPGAVGEARRLYDRAGVVPRATAIAADQRRLALEAIAGCRLPRLREVLEFLLDLAVPAGVADGDR